MSIAAHIAAHIATEPETVVLEGNKHCLRERWTGRELLKAVDELAAGLSASGLKAGDHVGLVADNHDGWLIADLACLSLGLVDVPRAGDMAPEDVAFVLGHADCKAVIVADAVSLERLRPHLGDLGSYRLVALLAGESPGEDIETLEGLRARGRERLSSRPGLVDEARNAVKESDLASIVYTSGTTGNPKGVMLSHGNILHNVRLLPRIVDFRPSDCYLSFLPTWHAFERTVEYCLLATCSRIAYGNKLTLRKDLPRVRPTLMAGVPRVWESLAAGVLGKLRKAPPRSRALAERLLEWSRRHAEHRRALAGRDFDDDFRIVRPSFPGRIGHAFGAALTWPARAIAEKVVFSKLKAALGGRLRFGISGGGALPEYVDEFFDRAGVLILNGYGLTETAPVASVRLPEDNVLRTSGRPLAETEFEVREEDGVTVCAPRQKGVLWIKGPQVMSGYYKNESASKEVLRDGWFCSGDLAVLTDKGGVVICGRVKDTIVLRGGENVEPEQIEAEIARSPLIADILVVGHTEKHLAGLVIPDLEALGEALPAASGKTLSEIADMDEARARIHQEIGRFVSKEKGFRTFELIPRITILPEPFSVETGTLTPTLKKRRPVIEERYKREIEALFEE